MYGLVVTVYLLSRFVMSVFYRPCRRRGPLPSVAIVIPAMNEQSAIERTIEAAFALDYPSRPDLGLRGRRRLDGRDLGSAWRFAARRFPNLHAIRFSHNRGKRAAMAAGIRATDAEIICFVDSDSSVAPDALREIVRPFVDPRVADGDRSRRRPEQVARTC